MGVNHLISFGIAANGYKFFEEMTRVVFLELSKAIMRLSGKNC